jgi:hypothetical protein
MTLSTRLTASINAAQQTALDLVTGKAELLVPAVLDLADGTGAGQADRMWSDRRTIAASGTDDLDLAGVLTDAFGAVVTFARVRGLLVKAAATNTNNVVVGGAASNQFATWAGGVAHTVNVRPGGMLLLGATDATSYAVTAGTGDLLRIANSGAGTSVTYDIVIIGASA